MMFSNPHNFNTAMSMLPGSGKSNDNMAPRRMVRAPSARGDYNVMLVIAVSFAAGLVTPFASRLLGL